jgi:hypothetical protein
MYSSYSFFTLALGGGEWSKSCPGRALPLGKEPLLPIGLEAGWASELVWTQARVKVLYLCWRSNPSHVVIQSVVRHYTDWATSAPVPLQTL